MDMPRPQSCIHTWMRADARSGAPDVADVCTRWRSSAEVAEPLINCLVPQILRCYSYYIMNLPGLVTYNAAPRETACLAEGTSIAHLR
jgi:hypothetical protein